jgi:hypothetical protein
MKTSSYGFVRAVVILLASATLTFAQTSGTYNGQNMQAPDSVRPGSLNYVEGQVSADGETLSPQSVGHYALKPGESLQTGTNGYAEVLLTPGAFLRVGPDSDLSMAAVGLADTRVNLTHGTAMIEADEIINGTRLSVGLGNSSADVLKKGLYSFNANEQVVRVLDGKLKVIGINKSRTLGRDDQVFLAEGDNLKKSDFNSNLAKQDPLYVWSEARGRAEANEDAALAQGNEGYAPTAAGWFWNPYAGYYGFWPADAYLYSPFGFGFGYGYGYYPGFYGGYYPHVYRGYHGLHYGRAAGIHAYGGFRGHAGGSFHGGGFHGGGGGFHGGGGHGGGGHR